MKTSTEKVFGIYFEESLDKDHSLIQNELPKPEYDEKLDINVFVDDCGRKIPCVECDEILGTRTVTWAEPENTDSDDQKMQIGPKTRSFDEGDDPMDVDDIRAGIDYEKIDLPSYMKAIASTLTKTKSYGEDTNLDD